MPSPRWKLSAALALTTTALLGCPREVSVHLRGAELARAEPDLTKKTRGLTIETSEGTTMDLDAATALTWKDDASIEPPRPVRGFYTGEAPLAYLLMKSSDKTPGRVTPRGPEGVLLDGTFRFREKDTTQLSTAGVVVTGTSGIVAVVDGFAIAITLLATGPDSSVDQGGTLRREGIVFAATAGVAAVGAIVWLAGNQRFRAKHGKHLGEGTFRGLSVLER